MPIPHQLTRLPGPWRVLGAAASWPVTSQQRACRNALVGSTALTARRRELQDVESFLADHAAARDPQPQVPHVPQARIPQARSSRIA